VTRAPSAIIVTRLIDSMRITKSEAGRLISELTDGNFRIVKTPRRVSAREIAESTRLVLSQAAGVKAAIEKGGRFVVTSQVV